MRIFSIDCPDFNECYKKLDDKELEYDLMSELQNEMLSISEVLENGASKKTTQPDQNQYHFDADFENYKYENDEIQPLSPINYDKMEPLDNGNTWSIKKNSKSNNTT